MRACCACALGMVALGLLSATATAAPTALLQIPTSDVLAEDTAYVDTAFRAYSGQKLTSSGVYLETQYAPVKDFEFGYDFPLSDPGAGLVNAKWRFDASGRDTWAVGIANVAPASPRTASAYVIGQRALGKWSYDYGFDWTTAGYGRAILGVHYRAKDDLTWMVDYVSGPQGSVTAGAWMLLGDRKKWNLGVGLVRDNQGGGKGIYVNVGRALDL